MTILHIASIDNNQCDGICVAVPNHVNEHSKLAIVGFINITNEKIFNIKDNIQLEYNKKFDIKNLQKPFNKPDIVVFHGCYRFDYINIYKNINANNIPYIIIPHGELRKEAQKKKKIKKTIANVLFFNKFIRKANGIQCLSKEENDNTNFQNSKKFIATNGVNLAKKKKNSFNIGIIRFLYVGRLEVKVKGIDLMITAVRKTANLMRKSNCILEIYGPDYAGRKKQVEKLIEKNKVKDIVKLHHEIMGNEKEKKMLESDVFIQTSRHEGMSMGILEALSYGIPCLVTKGTNMKEDINKYNAGWCAENNSESISNAIEKAITEQEIYGIKGKNAIKLIDNNYSWSTISKKTIQLYKKIIKGDNNEFKNRLS